MGDGEKLPEFDHSKLNCVVFDEVYMNSAYVLDRLGEFANTDPDRIITGVGDVQQLVLIEDLTNAENQMSIPALVLTKYSTMTLCLQLVSFPYMNYFDMLCKAIFDAEPARQRRTGGSGALLFLL